MHHMPPRSMLQPAVLRFSILRSGFYACAALCLGLLLPSVKSVAEINVTIGPTEIPRGDARGKQDITINNGLFAIALAVDTAPCRTNRKHRDRVGAVNALAACPRQRLVVALKFLDNRGRVDRHFVLFILIVEGDFISLFINTFELYSGIVDQHMVGETIMRRHNNRRVIALGGLHLAPVILATGRRGFFSLGHVTSWSGFSGSRRRPSCL